MIGIFLEAATPCAACGEPLALNALTLALRCPRCGAENRIELADWRAILFDGLADVPPLEDVRWPKGLFRPGERPFTLRRGRQAPRFGDTDSPISLDAAAAGLPSGRIVNSAGGSRWSVRALPPEFRELLSGVKFLLCEDPDLLPGGGGRTEASGLGPPRLPRAFGCPECGAILPVEERIREITCMYCHKKSALPDGFWERTDPVREPHRWYLWFDELFRSFDWEEELHDLVVDPDGRLYVACRLPHQGNLHLCCADRHRKVRWIRTDLEHDSQPRLVLTPDGLLGIWSQTRSDRDRRRAGRPSAGSRPAVTLLHLRDGTDAGGILDEAIDLQTLGCDPDGTYLTCRVDESSSDHYCDLVRFDRSGQVVPTWPEGPASSSAQRSARPPRFERTGHRPIRFVSRCQVSVGAEGSVFLWQGIDLLKFDRAGRRVYAVKLPFDRGIDRLCGDGSGNAYLLGRRDDAAFVLKILPDGKRAETLVANHRAGGVLDQETVLTLGADGTLYVAGDRGRWHVVAPDGEVRHSSRRSG